MNIYLNILAQNEWNTTKCIQNLKTDDIYTFGIYHLKTKLVGNLQNQGGTAIWFLKLTFVQWLFSMLC